MYLIGDTVIYKFNHATVIHFREDINGNIYYTLRLNKDYIQTNVQDEDIEPLHLHNLLSLFQHDYEQPVDLNPY